MHYFLLLLQYMKALMKNESSNDETEPKEEKPKKIRNRPLLYVKVFLVIKICVMINGVNSQVRQIC